ncbi:ribulose-bisphosphate carboxylase large subunit family protein [Aurantibacter crassamenti]|uniref:ribulose-bisphosphate carboxylase large subunit family protein n=1 Tax=Aurantibacter crassamenti TaxID=1837375 RepID=UPI001939BE81|nr:ribulose-bisphosphate carboxylase large subunit family protein [Aurantibacter crassamenti]MBM1105626.1 ribulose-bisphosphate carboxylase large subunit family protein [Aurantibacter crassamenti]
MERILAEYYIETPYDVEKAAAVLAGEQSSGTFVNVPGETAELKERFAARVEDIQLLDSTPEPSIPGNVIPNKAYQRAKVKVSWSVENFGYNLPVLISTLQGNLYEISQFTGLKLMDMELPDSFKEHYKGPKFGIKGSKKSCNVTARPIIGTIIKPSIGLSVEDTVTLVKSLIAAGIDFIKDDELMGSSANSFFDDRVKAIMKVIRENEQRTGKKVMYAFNISDEIDEMQRKYDLIVQEKGSCAMVSINSVGLAGTKKICDQGKLVIHGHRNGWGMLNRHPLLGIEFPAYQKIQRLIGVDQLHVNGIENKFWESDASVVTSIKSCLKPFLGGYEIAPVVSSGQWGGQAFETYKRTQTTDLLYMAGGGILAHPMGPESGVTALKHAWKGAVEGLSIEEVAQKSAEFKASVHKFSKQ